ncbi:Ryanodine Receptor 2 [Manis pentadactyla]|nr:Ryanodine Receptor 2 [Manis pentadactyla]
MHTWPSLVVSKCTCSEWAFQAVYSTLDIMKSMRFPEAPSRDGPSPVYCVERKDSTSHRSTVRSHPRELQIPG